MTTSDTRQPLRGALENISLVVAPVTLIGALIVHIGWTRGRSYFGYFGIDSSILKLSFQDYALRSADVIFSVTAWLVSMAVAAFVLDRIARAALCRPQQAQVRARARTSVAVAGALLLAAGLVSSISRPVAAVTGPWLGAGLLACGAILILRFGHSLPITGSSRARRQERIQLALAFGALAVAGFWAATVYAQELGTQAASNADAAPHRLPEVAVFSDKALDIPGSFVTQNRVELYDGQLGYRYSGLSLLTYANDRWFLIPGRRDGLRSSVLIIRDSESVRVEVAAPSEP